MFFGSVLVFAFIGTSWFLGNDVLAAPQHEQVPYGENKYQPGYYPQQQQYPTYPYPPDSGYPYPPYPYYPQPIPSAPPSQSAEEEDELERFPILNFLHRLHQAKLEIFRKILGFLGNAVLTAPQQEHLVVEVPFGGNKDQPGNHPQQPGYSINDRAMQQYPTNPYPSYSGYPYPPYSGYPYPPSSGYPYAPYPNSYPQSIPATQPSQFADEDDSLEDHPILNIIDIMHKKKLKLLRRLSKAIFH